MQGNHTTAEPRDWPGDTVTAGEDGHASQASCASGAGQLEGVENQPFPPPEGAPEDSRSICPVAWPGFHREMRKTNSSLFWGAGEGAQREKNNLLRCSEHGSKWKMISPVFHKSQQEDRVPRLGGKCPCYVPAGCPSAGSSPWAPVALGC